MSVVPHGAALQCRITTEDPANGFRPDTGRITAYRTPGGAGIRLDGGTHLGAEVSAHFDSMLVKLTCRGRDFPTAVRRARRAVAEFRIRGVSTNIPFLAGRPRRPGFPGRADHDVVHRRAPAAVDGAVLGRPRHQDPQLPGRRHGQHSRTVRGRRRCTRRTSCPRSTCRCRRHRAQSNGWPNWAPRDSPHGCATAGRSSSPTPRSATRISRCWPPGSAPRACSMVAPYIARLTPAVVVDGVLGWRDLRRGAAVPEGGSLGAVGRAA